MHTFQIGSLVLNGQLLFLMSFGLAGWLALRWRLKGDESAAGLLDAASVSFWIWLATWKLTPLLFDAGQAFREPMSLLIMDGGAMGQLLATVAVAVYLTRKANKTGWSLRLIVGSAVIYSVGGASAYEAFEAGLSAARGEMPWVSALAFGWAFLFAVWFYKRPSSDPAGIAGAVYLLGSAALAFGFEHRLAVALSLSAMQIACIGIAALTTAGQGRSGKAAVSALAISLIVYGAFGAGDGFRAAPPAGSEAAGEGIGKGDRAPDFELTNLKGETVELSDFRGRKVLVNFWATWCPPCRAEMPHIQKFYEKYGHSDVAVLSVNLTSLESRDDAAVKFAEKGDLTFPIVKDSDGSILSRYRVKAYPTTYVLDADGIVQDVIVGPMTYDFMRTLL